MASRRLYILTALAVLAVAAVTVDLATSSRGVVTSARLFPGIDEESLERVRWSGEKHAIVVERSAAGFVLVEPAQGPARESAIQAFVGALSIIESGQRADGNSPDRAVDIEITSGGKVRRFRIARSSNGASITIAGNSYRIPEYLARELDLELDDLRPRRPFPELGQAEATGIVVGPSKGESVVLEGPPWMVELPGSRGRAYADPDRVAAIERELRALRWSRLVDVDDDGMQLFYVRLRTGGDWVELSGLGVCEGGYLVSSPAGSGCVDSGPIDRIMSTGGIADALVDRHLVVPGRRGQIEGFEIRRGGRSLQVGNRDGIWRTGDTELDSEQVLRWLRRLDDIIMPTPEPIGTGGSELAEVVLELGQGERFTIRVVEDGEQVWVVRQGEGIRWPAAAGWAGIVGVDPKVFSSLELIDRPWADLELAVARSGGRVLERVEQGRNLGLWRTERGVIDGDAAQRLAMAVGYLAAIERLGAPPAGEPDRTVELRFRDAGDGPLELSIDLRAGTGGCTATLGQDHYRLAAPDCSALYGPWTTSSLPPAR